MVRCLAWMQSRSGRRFVRPEGLGMRLAKPFAVMGGVARGFIGWCGAAQ